MLLRLKIKKNSINAFLVHTFKKLKKEFFAKCKKGKKNIYKTKNREKTGKSRLKQALSI